MEAISEAKRHIDNAKGFLSNNARKEDGLYQDKKYVKIAGRTAYRGLIIAVDALLVNKKRKNEDWYQNELYQIDKKISAHFVTAYQILGTSMGSDRTRSAEIAKLGMETAEKIISWVENRLTPHTK